MGIKQHDVDGTATGDDNQLGRCRAMKRSYLCEVAGNSTGWPAVVVEVVLKGLKMQMIKDRSLIAVEAFASGPISEVPRMTCRLVVRGINAKNSAAKQLKAKELPLEHATLGSISVGYVINDVEADQHFEGAFLREVEP